MKTQNPAKTKPIESPTGEVIRELGGHAAGGLDQHSVAHITLPKGKGAAAHYHPDHEESYYILAGTADVTVDGETRQVSAGDMVAIPAKAIHNIHNPYSETVIFLAVCVPPWTPDCSVFIEE